MKRNKKNISNYIFCIITTLVLCELLFIRGMFTWMISCFSLIIAAIINIIINLKHKDKIIPLFTLLIVFSILIAYYILL